MTSILLTDTTTVFVWLACISAASLPLIGWFLVLRHKRSPDSQVDHQVDLPNIPGFQIKATIHTGTSATIYRAVDIATGQELALKAFHQTNDALKTGRPQASACNERNILSQLNCPHIIGLHSSQPNPEANCLALPLIHGTNLQQKVNQSGPLDTSAACRILRQLSTAIEHCHASGILHGDIAPSNVLIQHDSAVLIDFELAQSLHQSATPPPDNQRARGTPTCMPPEVASGEAPNEKSDLYSLGCVAYFLLTGQPLFSGQTSIEVCWKQIHRPIPALPTHPDDPTRTQLCTLTKQLIQKSPADRPRSATQVARQLADIAPQ